MVIIIIIIDGGFKKRFSTGGVLIVECGGSRGPRCCWAACRLGRGAAPPVAAIRRAPSHYDADSASARAAPQLIDGE